LITDSIQGMHCRQFPQGNCHVCAVNEVAKQKQKQEQRNGLNAN